MRDNGRISRQNAVKICGKISRGITGIFDRGILGGTLGEKDNASK